MPGWFKKDHSRRASPPDEREDRSARESAAEFRRELTEHLQARAELLGLEFREAGGWAARLGVLGLAAIALSLVAYALLLVAMVSLLGHWLAAIWPETFQAGGWQVVAIVFGLLHALGAFILFKKLKNRPPQALFEYTRAEFHKDRQWLQKKHSGNESDASS